MTSRGTDPAEKSARARSPAAGAAQDPVAEAARLFSRLTSDTPSTNGTRPPPAMVDQALVPGEPRPSPRPEADVARTVFLVGAALAATDRLSEVVDVVRCDIASNATDLTALGRAIERALAATNDRLTSLEQLLKVDNSASADAAGKAIRSLRATLQTVRRSTGP